MYEGMRELVSAIKSGKITEDAIVSVFTPTPTTPDNPDGNELLMLLRFEPDEVENRVEVWVKPWSDASQ